MGFYKMWLPELPELKRMLADDPDMMYRIRKADALVGPSDSVSYASEQIKSQNTK